MTWPTVLGVDGCRGGWVGVRLGGCAPAALAAPTIAELVAAAGPEVSCVGIDMPIGLPDDGPRAAEGLVRALLGARRSTVFGTLVRAAYAAPSYGEGQVVQRRATGTGFSQQSWGLRHKILEVDAWLRTGPPVRVVEVHPETSFAVLLGEPVAPGKKTPEGREARRTALREAGIEPPDRPRGGVAEDDLLDACIVAWSAARVVRGEASSFPAVPETFSDGWPAAIWA
jgi:predicted RNase H-like nuclease